MSNFSNLLELLGSTNSLLRCEAISALSNFSLEDKFVRDGLLNSLQSKYWNIRVSAAEAFSEVICTSARRNLVQKESTKIMKTETLEFIELDGLDTRELVFNYKPLLSCTSSNYLSDNVSSRSNVDQRKLLNEHLEEYRTGLIPCTFIADDDLNLNQSINDGSEECKTDLLIDSSLDNVNNDVQNFDSILQTVMRRLFNNLLKSDWQMRHGAVLVTSKLANALPIPYLLRYLDELAVRLLQVLALDRFTDYISGCNAVAPVRESAAQSLSFLMLNVSLPAKFTTKIIGHLLRMLTIEGFEQWHSRYTALLVFRYYFSLCHDSVENFNSIFDCVLSSMSDDDDEVISRAITALSCLFENPNIASSKETLIRRTMTKVWEFLGDEEKLDELIHDVNSVLFELVNIAETWLRSDSTSNLSDSQLLIMVRLIDAKAVKRSTSVLKCFGIALIKNSTQDSSVIKHTISNEIIFKLIQSMYRSILFTSCEFHPKETEKCFNEIFTVLFRILNDDFYSRTLSAALLLSFIAKCISYLLNSHRHLNIRDDDHCGNNDFDSFCGTICGEEIFALAEDAQNETLTTRKVIAGRFLGSILFYIFRSATGTDLVNNLQTFFLPLLYSNSLYQRLGAAIVLNCFSREYRREIEKSNSSQVLSSPALLIKVLQEVTVLTNDMCYVEVNTAISSLTREINEFQQYCAQRGVPSEEMLQPDAKGMEDVASAAFHALDKRLTRSTDKDSLNIRYSVVLDSIRSARIAHKTNARRIKTLLASALLNFGSTPESFTPILRLLFDITDECNSKMIEEIYGDSFPIIFTLATARNAANTVGKILNNFAATLVQELTIIGLQNENSSISTIYSLSVSLKNTKKELCVKANNIRYSFRRLADHFGSKFLEICQQYGNNVVSLNVNGFEDFIRNFQFLVELHEIYSQNDWNHELFAALHNYNRPINAYWKGDNAETLSSDLFFKHHIMHPNPSVRYCVCRLLAALTRQNLSAGLNLYYLSLEAAINNFTDAAARCGAAELLLQLADGDAMAALGAVSLLAPLALKMIGDQLDEVRTAAANAFSKYVALLALGNRTTSSLEGLRPEVKMKYELNQNFAKALSNPSGLPLIRRNQIPHLSANISLRHYQLEGITWLAFLADFGLNGILADDMGLGKTLQVLSLLDMQQNSSTITSASLIVCPRTLIPHWCNEWRKYFPDARRPFITIADLLADRTLEQFLRENWAVDLVLVVSYSELKTWKCLSEFRWNFVVLDEGHCIRNPSSQLYKAVTSIIAHHRLILSGTPVQNSPADLWALFTYLMPGYLSTKTNFNLMYLNKVMASRNPKANKEQVEESEKALKALHSRVLPFILRRLKTDVLKELPEKIVQDYYCEMSTVQRRLYSLIVQNSSVASTASSNSFRSVQSSTILFSVLQTMILLRKLIDHPLLVADTISPLLEKQEEFADIQKQLRSSDCSLSGKMAALRELLCECQIGGTFDKDLESVEYEIDSTVQPIARLQRQKALIFCQWRSSAALISNYLREGHFGTKISYLLLDGGVPLADRQSIVERFNYDQTVDLLILTTQVGGVGLTLTGANIVIFVDHNWNPVVDLQAMDRAHRLGQTRTVNVYRLITKDSIEEKVMNLQNFKNNTANALIGAANHSLSSMSSSDLSELINLTPTINNQTATVNKEPMSKRPRTVTVDEPAIYSLETLWDVDQYDEVSSIDSFIKNVSNIQ